MQQDWQATPVSLLMSSGYSLLAAGSSPMALLAGTSRHVELAGSKQWWGADISEISVDVAWTLPSFINLQLVVR